MTWALIGINLGAFLFEILLPMPAREALFYRFGVVPARFSDPQWAAWTGLPLDGYWPFLTSMFLHGGLLHIVANMWTLWIFGDNVEDRMGPIRFLIFYLTCGLGAGLLHWLTNPSSVIPTVGASGAIAGVLGAYLLLYPHARVITIFPVFFYPLIFELPAVFYLAFWFMSQLFSGFASLASPQDVGGVAWWAHVGGFVAGMVLLRLFVLRRPPPPRRGERHFVLREVPRRQPLRSRW